MNAAKTRAERDSMGSMEVPADAYYGAQTARAVENFPISNLRLGSRFIRAMAMIKRAGARVNGKLGGLDEAAAKLIEQAASEVVDGKLDDQFVVDVFQTGSGTSTNMNTNEVIAGRANELAGKGRGGKDPVHPNDHVNRGQSSNDVIPTAIHLSVAESLKTELIPALAELQQTLQARSNAFAKIIKIGRTHLQDATPVCLGQVFGGYTVQVGKAIDRSHQAISALRELPIGGTAVGTGINTHPDFAKGVCALLSEQTGIEFVEAANHFEAQAAKDAVVQVSGLLRPMAISLTKIANDVRYLASGPRGGIGEISLPSTQPGSSIMPGKVNPVMCESVIQVAAHVVGNDAAVGFAGALGGNFELHVLMPVMAYNMLESIGLLASVSRAFADKCIKGIEANTQRCEELIEQSLAMCTSLAPLIGYDDAADIAKESFKTGKTVRQVARERKVLSDEQLQNALNPMKMTEPG